MRLLLDTHIAIWWVADDPRLGARARELIGDGANAVAVSAVSIWEIAIKYPLLKRVGAPPFGAAEALLAFREEPFDVVSVIPEHAAMVERLPPMHADPFDRLLLAQAIYEDMRFLTADQALATTHPSIVRA